MCVGFEHTELLVERGGPPIAVQARSTHSHAYACLRSRFCTKSQAANNTAPPPHAHRSHTRGITAGIRRQKKSAVAWLCLAGAGACVRHLPELLLVEGLCLLWQALPTPQSGPSKADPRSCCALCLGPLLQATSFACPEASLAAFGWAQGPLAAKLPMPSLALPPEAKRRLFPLC